MTLRPDLTALLPADHEVQTRRNALVDELRSNRPRRRPSRTVLAGCFVMVGIGGATAAYAAVGPGFGPDTTPRQASAIKTGAVPQVQNEITGNFALFRKPATPMPADLAAQAGSPTRYGRNTKLARSFLTPYGVGWAIPGDTFICIVVPTPPAASGPSLPRGSSASCNPTRLVLRRGLSISLIQPDDPERSLDVLLLPDALAAKDPRADPNGVIAEIRGDRGR